jgi:hypothetical protein
MRLRWICLLLLAFLLGAVQTSAQVTPATVTGQVLDPRNVPYSGARLSITLNNPGPGSPTLTPCPSGNGCVIQNPGAVTLDVNGNVPAGGIALYPNANILPAGTTYTFTVNETPGELPPWGTGPQIFSVANVTITGPTFDLTSLFAAAPPPYLTQPFNGGGSGNIGGSGTPGFLSKFITSITIGNSPCDDTLGMVICNEPISANSAYAIPATNSASGTTQFLSITYDTAGNAITASPSDKVGGIAGPGAGTSGTVQVVIAGVWPWTCDNQTTVGDWLIESPTINGECHDAGAVEPTGPANIARVKVANSGPGTNTQASVFTPDTRGSVSGTSIQVNGVVIPGPTGNFNTVSPAADAGFQALPYKQDGASPVTGIVTEVPQATTSVPGILQLNPDLCGTFSAVLVCGLQGNPLTIISLQPGQVICATGIAAFANCYLGVIPTIVSGTSDPIPATVRGGWRIYTNAGNVAATIAAPTGAFGANLYFAMVNNGGGTVTLTPSGATITKNGPSATAAASLPISPGQWCQITTDNSNWYANCAAIGTSGYSTIEVSGVAVTQRATENYIPAGLANVVCNDNPGASRTDCSISASSGGAGPAGVFYTNVTSYTIPTSDNQIEDKFTAGSSVAIALPQPNSIATSPFNATRYTGGVVSCTPTCTTGSFTPTAGGTLVVGISWVDQSASVVSTLTDSAGAPCSRLAGVDPTFASSGGHTYSMSAWKCSPATASSQTISYTFNTNTTQNGATVVDYTVLTFDTSAQNSLSNPSTNTNLAVGPMNTGYTNEILVAVSFDAGASSLPTGFILRDSSSQLTSSDRLVSSLGSYTVLLPTGPSTNGGILSAVGTWAIANPPGFTSGWKVTLTNAGTAPDTVTPASSMINSKTTLVIVPNESCDLTSDGTNYSATCRSIPNQQTNGIMGQAVEIAGLNFTSTSSDAATTTLFPTGAADAFYWISGNVTCRATVAGVETLTITFTDTENQTHTYTASEDCTTPGASPLPGELLHSFRVKGGTNIQYGTAHTGSQPTYDLSIALHQLSTQ